MIRIDPTTAALTAALIAAILILVVFASGWKPLTLKTEVLAVLQSGETLKGTLLARRPTFIVLAHVSVLEGSDKVIPVDGHVQIDRSNVVWLQVP